MKKKYSFIIFLLFSSFSVSSQSNDTHVFEIINIEGERIIKSCIDLNLYNEKVTTPNKKAVRSNTNPILLYKAYWKENCLYLPILNMSLKEVNLYIQEFTSLKENQIQILNGKS